MITSNFNNVASAAAFSFASGLAGLIFYALQKHSKHVQECERMLATANISDDSIFRVFQPHLVPLTDLSQKGYSSVLALVQVMIGVRPNCDMVLEIWPPAFECYNIVVPNFLNFPASIFNSLRHIIPLATYASSRANQCAYCTAHCCSFAVRRGVDPSILNNLLEVNPKLSAKEAAVIRVAYGLGTVPSSLQKSDVNDINQHLSEEEVEWIVAAAAMFGSFNKLMDGLGIPLENETYAETIGLMDSEYDAGRAKTTISDLSLRVPSPPTDDWTMYVKMLFEGVRPGGALWLDNKLQEGTPASATECADILVKATGQSFPIVARLKHDRFRRALTSVILRNFDENLSAGLGIRRKIHAGIEYAKVLANNQLVQELKVTATKYPREEMNGKLDLLVMKVGKAVSYTPNRFSAELISEIQNNTQLMTPSMLIELVSFFACLQTLHRIEAFYEVQDATSGIQQ